MLYVEMKGSKETIQIWASWTSTDLQSVAALSADTWGNLQGLFLEALIAALHVCVVAGVLGHPRLCTTVIDFSPVCVAVLVGSRPIPVFALQVLAG